jgi:hypothetical protein
VAWYPQAERHHGPPARVAHRHQTPRLKLRLAVHSPRATWHATPDGLPGPSRPAPCQTAIRNRHHVARHCDTAAIASHPRTPEPNPRNVAIEIQAVPRDPVTRAHPHALATTKPYDPTRPNELPSATRLPGPGRHYVLNRATGRLGARFLRIDVHGGY